MANLVLNPSAAVDLTGWTTLSGVSLTRVTSVPGTAIPAPASTAFRLDVDSELVCDPIAFPGAVGEGDTLYVSVDVSPGGTAANGEWKIDIDWYADIGEAYSSWTTLVQNTGAMAAGWTHYDVSAVIPAGVVGFDLYLTDSGTTDGTYAYYTNVTVAADAALDAEGTIGLVGQASLSLTSEMQASGTITLAGSAWLSARNPGQDTFTATGHIRLSGSARLSRDTDPVLPPTDDDGWTLPDVTPPDLRGLTVRLSGLAIVHSQITDLTIELDVEGGPKSATLSLNCPLDRKPSLGRDTLLVTYKTQVLFRGRLENIVGDVSSSTGYTLTYAGPLVTLRDHKAYRQVFVDSDLASWRVDQGPQTSPDTFEGITAGLI